MSEIETFFSVVLAVVLIAAGLTFVAALVALSKEEEGLPNHIPQWEVRPAVDGGDVVGYQVRWSIPDAKGRFLWVGHYYSGPDNSLRWCQVAAESHCKRLNVQKKLPCDFDSYMRVAP